MNAELKTLTKPNQRTAIVGDIFVNSWGYGQTNIDFYQVVGITKSGKSIKIRAINGHTTNSGYMCGDKTPKPNNFKSDKIFTKRLYYYENVPHINMEYGCCELWDGKPERCSWYA